MQTDSKVSITQPRTSVTQTSTVKVLQANCKNGLGFGTSATAGYGTVTTEQNFEIIGCRMQINRCKQSHAKMLAEFNDYTNHSVIICLITAHKTHVVYQ